MKTKLQEKRFKEDLYLIRKVLNEVVFVEQIKQGANFEKISLGIPWDFIESSQQMEIFGVKREGEKIIALEVAEGESRVDIARKYLIAFRELCPTGKGFTARIATHPD